MSLFYNLSAKNVSTSPPRFSMKMSVFAPPLLRLCTGRKRPPGKGTRPTNYIGLPAYQTCELAFLTFVGLFCGRFFGRKLFKGGGGKMRFVTRNFGMRQRGRGWGGGGDKKLIKNKPCAFPSYSLFKKSIEHIIRTCLTN